MEEIITNIHIHTRYSDGKKLHREIAKDAIEAGSDAIIITDHNVYVKGFDRYYSKNDHRVLMIVGEEIHDKTRIPQKNHLLAIGINHSHARYARSSQELINSLNKVHGLSFIAHSYDPELATFNEEDLSWEDWSVSGYTGLELWNNLSEFKIRVSSIPAAFFYGFFPAFLAKEPPIQIRKKWDSLLAEGKKVVAIGGTDAHTLTYNFGPFRKTVFPYSYHFKTINTHVLVENELSGDAKKDSELILSALGKGNAFVSNDRIKSGKGFRFNLIANGNTFTMGDEVVFSEGLVLTADLPAEAECVLLRDGEPVLQNQKCRRIYYPVEAPGCYRLECYRRHLFERRGWLFSNPFYIR
jgi:hypothetical protein